MTPMRALGLCAWLPLAAALLAAPAFAADGPAPADPDEKLPAQLPSVTIQGEDLSGTGDRGQGKLPPTMQTGGSQLRLPEPTQRRATSENNQALMVNVTPTTLEAPAALPGTRLPYTSLLGGWGPLTQYRAELYDARYWGPALGVTRAGGQAGWGWSGWKGQESLDWPEAGRLDLSAQGFSWERERLSARSETSFHGALAHDVGDTLTLGVDAHRGEVNAGAQLLTQRGTGAVHWHPEAADGHQPQVDLTGQYRTWGAQAGPEGYLGLSDFWSISDQFQLEGGLGGGFWGREPILDPMLGVHYRPLSSTHLYARVKTMSELPDFDGLYGDRLSVDVGPDLQAERVEGVGELGASQRLNEIWWASLTASLRRSHRHIYWANPDVDALWTPVNAATEQWSPGADLRLQAQWLPTLTQDVTYGVTGVYPLGLLEHTLGTRLDGTLLERRLGVSLGLEGRMASLSAQQMPTGGVASGVFAGAELRYALTSDWTLSLTADQVPVALTGPAAGYFGVKPWLTVNAQYQF